MTPPLLVPTTPPLGIIEGYFGRAWSWPDRAAVVDLLAPAGYSFFHYAPKIDAKLRRNWQELHSPEEMDALAAFANHCRARGMRFGIGLTPYGAHLDFSTEVKSNLAHKLAALDALGLDDLAILFDDMRGDLPDLAERQAEIIAFALDHSKAAHFFTCPSYYSNDPVLDRVFGTRPDCYLETFGKCVDPAVQVYWTGEEVCSAQYSVGHLRQVAEQLGRKVCLWDNYPVNDGPRMSNHLHLRGFTGRPAEIGNWISGHAINPASQPTLSCIPALTLGESYALAGDYCYGEALRKAAEAVVGTELAAILHADLLTFQNVGLDRLQERLPRLNERYKAINHAAAREVVDWLNGGYAITGEMLQTQ
jgi:hyaluronoglucosaminidase